MLQKAAAGRLDGPGPVVDVCLLWATNWGVKESISQALHPVSKQRTHCRAVVISICGGWAEVCGVWCGVGVSYKPTSPLSSP